jgi:hypothetical protein
VRVSTNLELASQLGLSPDLDGEYRRFGVPVRIPQVSYAARILAEPGPANRK